jgi:ribose 5-phosphate isomerase A
MASSRSPSTAVETTERYKSAAATSAAALVCDGLKIGLGTGSTVAYLLPALAARGLDLQCVATSEATGHAAAELGLKVRDLDELGTLDIAIDGADQIDPNGWLIKGGGAAHTREKIVASAARRFVVIASAEKAVSALSAPVPLEIMRFGAQSTLRAAAPASLRDVPPSPDGNLIADYLGDIGDPQELARWLSNVPGLIEHGLFEPSLVSDILIAGPGGVEHLRMRDT